MSRDGWIAALCLAGGSLLLLLGALIPAHLRAVDRGVLRLAGEGGASVIEVAEGEIADGKQGPARLLTAAAREAGVADGASLREIETRLEATSQAAWWGGSNAWLETRVGPLLAGLPTREMPVLEWVLREDVRTVFLRSLAPSTEPAVIALLACRKIQDTTLLPPVPTASGQPMDAGLLLAAALIEGKRMHPGLAIEFERAAMVASRGKGTAALENGLLDLLTAARRLSWESLASLLERCENATVLHRLVASAGSGGERWKELYAFARLGGGADSVVGYVRRHGERGWADLRRAMVLGEGAVKMLLRTKRRIDEARWREVLAVKLAGERNAVRLVELAWRAPVLALATKYLLWLDGFFLLACGAWYAWRVGSVAARTGWPSRPDYALVAVAAGTLLVLVVLVKERLLVPRWGAPSDPVSVSVPVLRARLRVDLSHVTKPAMNEKVVGMLVAFFVLQLSIYLLGLGRIRGIRDRVLPDAIKLRLIDNEESLFDAPLYIGIAGSVLALVLRLTGFEEVSLMASYSSTLFGILFCFVLKVMHVRPYRQRLILESTRSTEP